MENNKLVRDCELKCELEVGEFLNAFVELPEEHVILGQTFEHHIRPKTDFLREQCKLRLIRLHEKIQQDMSHHVQKYCEEVQDAMNERVNKSVMWEEKLVFDQYQLLKRAAKSETSNDGSGQDKLAYWPRPLIAF